MHGSPVKQPPTGPQTDTAVLALQGGAALAALAAVYWLGL